MNMFPVLRHSLPRIAACLLSRPSPVIAAAPRFLHCLQCVPPRSKPLLSSTSPLVNLTCGFKVKSVLKKRCKDCYMVVRDQRCYIICPTHPRHKQMSFVKKEKNLRIMTPFAVQGKLRPW